MLRCAIIALAKTRKVIAVHLQGHGRTDDIDRPLRFSATMQRDGSFPEVIAAFDHTIAHAPHLAQNTKGSSLGRLYPNVNWETVLRKIAEMESHDFDWSEQVNASASHDARLCRR